MYRSECCYVWLPSGAELVEQAERDDRGVNLSVRRRHLERTLSTEAAQLDGIDRARVRCRPNRISVAARTSRRDPQGLDDSLRSLVGSELERLDLDDSPDVRVRVDQGDRG